MTRETTYPTNTRKGVFFYFPFMPAASGLFCPVRRDILSELQASRMDV